MARRGSPFSDVGGRKIMKLTGPFARVVANGGSGGGGSSVQQALIAASVAALGAGPFADGQLAVIRVGTWPDVEYVELVRDGNAGKWIGKPHPLITQSDQAYMGVNTTALSYLGTNNAGGSTGFVGWSTRPVRRTAQMLAAGLKLQANIAAILQGPGAGVSVSVVPRFFQHDDGDTVAFSSDGSTAAAEIALLTSPANANITFKASGWQDVVKLGTSTPLAAADVTKANLWPRLYAKVLSGVSYGSIIDTDLAVRWVA